MSGGSVRPPASPRPHSAVPAFQLPQEQPECAIDCWVAAQSRQSENESEVDGGRNQLFQDGAAGGAPLSYAGSVASTMHSRQGQPLHKALKNLQKSISKISEENAEHKGEQQIRYETKYMTDCAKKLLDKVDLEPEIEAHLLVVIEEALDQSEHFASYASMRLDKLSLLDKEERALIQARPKLSYEVFRGDIGTWATFQQNQQEIYKMFANKSAIDGGEGQQIFQLSKIPSQELATTVMSFSGAQDGPAKAVKWLNVKFNSPHLLLPRVYQD